ncbi:molybdopterin molybdotransferase MoeA [bacterium]|nr:molybdopterin molybdotransferase MoeA [bacterium]
MPLMPFRDAENLLYSHLKPITKTEDIPLLDAVGRVVAEDVKTDRDFPPFDRVAMDGFACRFADIDGAMTLVGSRFAGDELSPTVHAGECVEIMTGAPLPQGADCVFQIEVSESEGNQVRCSRPQMFKEWSNVARKGEDIKKGAVILHKKSVVTPAHTAVAASAGKSFLTVFVQPKVAIITTGSEIVEIENQPEPWQIRNSNAPQLQALFTHTAAITADYVGIVEDTLEVLTKKIGEVAKKYDIIVFTGGVSRGKKDFVADAMKENSFEILFNRLAIKPGRPLTVAVRDGVTLFGLPGNPVSVFVTFYLAVLPFLYALQQTELKPVICEATLVGSKKRRMPTREEYLPVWYENGIATLIEYHGSGDFTAVSKANALLSLPVGVSEIVEGQKVNVRLI